MVEQRWTGRIVVLKEIQGLWYLLHLLDAIAKSVADGKALQERAG